ncbi:MAG: hypothetical protein PUB66_07245 [Oscillospiraceae bacterium]|nr:hypothetical protein [Oscillospiraceae bacterium]
MSEQDTVRLLRECDAGVKMGISSIDDVLDYVRDNRLKTCLSDCLVQHEQIQNEISRQLQLHGDGGKEPAAMAKGMSWLKTNVKLAVNESDEVVADLVTDGCNMGVKSLSRYFNQYPAADDKAKKLASRLVKEEERLACQLRDFL